MPDEQPPPKKHAKMRAKPASGAKPAPSPEPAPPAGRAGRKPRKPIEEMTDEEVESAAFFKRLGIDADAALEEDEP